MRKLSLKKESSLVQITQVGSVSVGNLTQVCPLLVSVRLSAPFPLTRPRRQRQAPPPHPLRAALLIPAPPWQAAQGTKLAQRHAWGRVRSLGWDDLGLPGPHQTVSVPVLSVYALPEKATS